MLWISKNFADGLTFVSSPDVTLCDWLGSKHQLSKCEVQYDIRDQLFVLQVYDCIYTVMKYSLFFENVTYLPLQLY